MKERKRYSRQLFKGGCFIGLTSMIAVSTPPGQIKTSDEPIYVVQMSQKLLKRQQMNYGLNTWTVPRTYPEMTR